MTHVQMFNADGAMIYEKQNVSEDEAEGLLHILADILTSQEVTDEATTWTFTLQSGSTIEVVTPREA